MYKNVDGEAGVYNWMVCVKAIKYIEERSFIQDSKHIMKYFSRLLETWNWELETIKFGFFLVSKGGYGRKRSTLPK